MQITNRQVAALRDLIARARLSTERPDLSVLACQLVWRLIEASEGMTKAVFVTLTSTTEDFTGEEIHKIAEIVGALNSSNSTTHFGALLALMGTEFCLGLHYGSFTAEGTFSTEGQFFGWATRSSMVYTFWLGNTPFPVNLQGQEVRVTRDELAMIDLMRDGLYS